MDYLNDWLYARIGRLTASEIHKLFVSGKKKDELFGQGALTYIRTKAAEILTQEIKDEVDFKQAEWGKSNEAEAVARFEKETGIRGEYFGAGNPKFFPIGDYLGFSPDWINELYVSEIKCPWNSAEHLKNLMLQSAEDLSNERWEYYCQLQMAMYHHGALEGFFVSYDPRFAMEHMQIKIIEVSADENWIEEYNKRIPAAIELLKEMVTKFINPIVATYDNEVNATIIQNA